jgi:uncharacterized protein
MPDMNREQKIRRAHFLHRGLNAAAIVLVTSLAGSPFAHAVSFRCPHNASASERLVCSDPTLSALDDKLAALYRNAFNATTDSAALEADRVSQWQWRQHNCKDTACVTDWYNRRIAELEGDLKHGKESAVQRVKEGVANQQLAPSAQDAVLEMNGVEPAHARQHATPVSSADSHDDATKTAAANATLKLQKMPSGVAADERQKRLAQAHAHHLPVEDVAPSAHADTSTVAAKVANASAVVAIAAAGMAPLDAPAGKSANSTTTNESANGSADMALEHAAAQPVANGVTCSSGISPEPARPAESSSQQGAVALK